jgi:hypothetical protein
MASARYRGDFLARNTFKVPSSQLRAIAPGLGSAFATDGITVGGRRVGYMYREEPDDLLDSGWRFLCGDESPEYLDESGHLEIHDVNRIANHDPDIVPHLRARFGSAFERRHGSLFVEVKFSN